MPTMRAIKIQGPNEAKIVSNVPIPVVRPGHLLVKVECVGLNPTDWKHIDFLATANATSGCDYSATVVEVGPEVVKTFEKGDRVAGFAHGGNCLDLDDGAFAHYAVVVAEVALKIPDSISFEEAATLGVAITTVGQGLYQSLGLPLPTSPAKEKFPVLIYGGSTGTGLLMMQFAKLSGLEVITTCSPRNFDLVKKYGADIAFDYNDPDCGKKIREHTKNKLKFVEDCITDENITIPICAAAISSDGTGAKYSALLDFEDYWPRADVLAEFTMTYTATGKKLKFGEDEVPVKPGDKEFSSKFWSLAQGLLEQGKIKLFPTARIGGLEGIFEGLDDLRHGRVSGQKLVYRITDWE